MGERIPSVLGTFGTLRCGPFEVFLVDCCCLKRSTRGSRVVVVGRINDEHETRHNPIQAKAHSTKLLYMRGTVMERGERESGTRAKRHSCTRCVYQHNKGRGRHSKAPIETNRSQGGDRNRLKIAHFPCYILNHAYTHTHTIEMESTVMIVSTVVRKRLCEPPITLFTHSRKIVKPRSSAINPIHRIQSSVSAQRHCANQIHPGSIAHLRLLNFPRHIPLESRLALTRS